MKITESNLDKELVKKINRLDDIFNSGDKNQFLFFDGNSIKTKKNNEKEKISLNSVKRLSRLSSFLNVEEEGFENAISSEKINFNNIKNKKFKFLNVKLKPESEIRLKNKIILFKKNNEQLLIVTDYGTFHRIDLSDKKNNIAFNILELIKAKFAISNIFASDILSLLQYKNKLLVSFLDYGIFEINLENLEISILTNFSNIISMEEINGKLFCIRSTEKENVLVFDLEEKVLVNIFNNISKLNQIPTRLKKFNNRMFVLSKNFDKHNTNNILHCWVMDKAGISFNNIDYRFSAIKEDIRLIPKFISVDGENLLLVCFRKKNIVVFKYNANQINLPPEILNFSLGEFDLADSNLIKFKNNNLVLNIKNRIIIINKENQIERNYSTDLNKVDFIEDIGENILVSSNELVLLFKEPIFDSNNICLLKLKDKNEKINSLSLFVNGNFLNSKINLSDSEAQEILPDFKESISNGFFLKTKVDIEKEIFLRIELGEKDSVYSLGIYKDFLF